MGSLVLDARALTFILDTHSASSCTSINNLVTQAHWCGEPCLEKTSVRWLTSLIGVFFLLSIALHFYNFREQTHLSRSRDKASRNQSVKLNRDIKRTKPTMLIKRPPPYGDRPMQVRYHALYFIDTCLVSGILPASVSKNCQHMWSMGLWSAIPYYFELFTSLA